VRNPYLENVRGIDDVKRFPSLAEIQHAWTTASHALRDRPAEMTPAEQDASIACPFPLPVSEPTALSLLTFFFQHDSYHIGQLALLRKHAGPPGDTVCVKERFYRVLRGSTGFDGVLPGSQDGRADRRELSRTSQNLAEPCRTL
jgi:hypothetical protein